MAIPQQPLISIESGGGAITASWALPGNVTLVDVSLSKLVTPPGTPPAAWLQIGTAARHKFANLANGTRYKVRVRFLNADGTSPEAEAVGLPLGPAITRETLITRLGARFSQRILNERARAEQTALIGKGQGIARLSYLSPEQREQLAAAAGQADIDPWYGEGVRRCRREAPTAPVAACDAAVEALVAYMLDVPIEQRRLVPANAWYRSGAAAMLQPWRERVSRSTS